MKPSHMLILSLVIVTLVCLQVTLIVPENSSTIVQMLYPKDLQAPALHTSLLNYADVQSSPNTTVNGPGSGGGGRSPG